MSAVAESDRVTPGADLLVFSILYSLDSIATFVTGEPPVPAAMQARFLKQCGMHWAVKPVYLGLKHLVTNE